MKYRLIFLRVLKVFDEPLGESQITKFEDGGKNLGGTN